MCVNTHLFQISVYSYKRNYARLTTEKIAYFCKNFSCYFCKNFSCIKGACFCGARSIFPLLGMDLVVKNIKLADNKGM